MIIDGKKIANEILEDLKSKTKDLKNKPSLAVILANDNPASEIYVKNKKKKCEELGFNSEIFRFDRQVSQKNIINLIEKLNDDKNTNAILVQLPLFSHLSPDEIIQKINPKKDVDGFHPMNAGLLNTGLKPWATPCTPKGIIKLLKAYNIELTSKNALVIGRSNIVGKPISALLTKENATVTLAHTKTKNLKELCLNSDIIVSCAGSINLITKDMVRENSIIIDVGINKQEGKLKGDVDFENVKDKVSLITPVPGGVGPMTIACLMENTFELYMEQNK